MRKPAFCICENKDADQLCGNHTADQRLCFRYGYRIADLRLSFRYTDSAIPLLPKFKYLAFFCGCTARFLSDRVGNPEGVFSHDAVQI